MGLTALFGGTFNPFHIGHYEMLALLCRRDEIDEVWIMPDRIPPHKTCDYLAPETDRLRMCELAAADFEKAKVSDFEFQRDGRSYTFDTIRLLKERYPEKHFAICCGGDMIATLESWYRGPELIREAPFYAFCRAGEPGFIEAVAKLRSHGADITAVGGDITEVSSTKLRSMLKNGSAGGLIPEKIEKYIRNRGLYV